MYNLYNFEARPSYLINTRNQRTDGWLTKIAEVGTALVIFSISFFWLFI